MRSNCFSYNNFYIGIMQKEEEFLFSDISEKPVPSLLRGYSAPIRLDSDLTDRDLFFLLAHDSDEFNRYIFATSYYYYFTVWLSK